MRIAPIKSSAEHLRLVGSAAAALIAVVAAAAAAAFAATGSPKTQPWIAVMMSSATPAIAARLSPCLSARVSGNCTIGAAFFC